MMNKKEFTKFAKRVLSSHKNMKRPEMMQPTREWGVGILIAVIIFGVSAWWSAQTYNAYKNISVESQSITQEVVVYRESLVEAALEQFANRVDMYAVLIEQQPVAPNPIEDIPDEEVDDIETKIATSSETEIIEETPTEQETEIEPDSIPDQGIQPDLSDG